MRITRVDPADVIKLNFWWLNYRGTEIWITNVRLYKLRVTLSHPQSENNIEIWNFKSGRRLEKYPSPTALHHGQCRVIWNQTHNSLETRYRKSSLKIATKTTFRIVLKWNYCVSNKDWRRDVSHLQSWGSLSLKHSIIPFIVTQQYDQAKTKV